MVFNTLLQRRLFHSLPSASNFIIPPAIKKALQNGGPVVALESTIISHGIYSIKNNNKKRLVWNIYINVYAKNNNSDISQ